MEDLVTFGGVFQGRRVLVTGHTGFKGSWLCQWLLMLGADVTGLALPPATKPALFELLRLGERLSSHFVDIRDFSAVLSLVERTRPEFVFHLAAQPLVRHSYAEPKETWDVNAGGTVNLLEAIRTVDEVIACVVVTTDKCYENREQIWGYRERDRLGGHDPYSASKAATELAVESYRASFFASRGTRVASARAGNAIGGGDWSPDRLATDFVLALESGQPLVLRQPEAVRPWQHVLEPLSGYLLLGARLLTDGGEGLAEAWNFGPAEEALISVRELAGRMIARWGSGRTEERPEAGQPHEAGLLSLDCTKARTRLGWHGTWTLDQAVEKLVEWHRAHSAGEKVLDLTYRQVQDYVLDARRQGLEWARELRGKGP